MMQRRLLLMAAGLVPFAGGAAVDPWLGDWVATMSHADESTPFGLRLEADDKLPGKLRVKVSAPVVHVWDAVVGSAVVDGQRLIVNGGAWVLSRSRDGQRLLGSSPEFLVPRLRLPLVFSRGQLKKTERQLPRLPEPRVVWRAELAAALWADLLRAGDTLFAGDDSGQLHALDVANGSPRWQAKTGGALRARPLLDAGEILLPSDDGLLYAFDAESGRERWRLPLQAQAIVRIPPGQQGARFDRFGAAAAVLGDVLLTASPAGTLAAWDRHSRAPRWKLEIGHSLLGTPVVAQGLVLVGAFDGSLRAVELASGRERWRAETGEALVSTVWVEGGLVLIGSRSYELFAFRLSDGHEVWRRYHWFSWVESAVNGLDGRVYVGSSDGAHLSCLDPASGRVHWRQDVAGWAWGQPALDARRVAIGTAALGGQGYGSTHRGAVWSFDRVSGMPQWRLPLPVPAERINYGVTGSLALGAQGEVFAGTLAGELLCLMDP
jgi:outer membrane protein assembly factor BamB